MLNMTRVWISALIFGGTFASSSCMDLASGSAVAEDGAETEVPAVVTSVCIEASEYLSAEPSFCTEAFTYEHTTCSVPTVTAVIVPEDALTEDAVDDEMPDCDEQDCD